MRVLPAPTSPLATKGQWSSVINLPLVPVAAATLPDGKVLFWSAYDRYAFGGSSGQTYTALFNPSTNQTTEKLVTETGHDMFCPGTTMLSDGRLLVNGGSNAEVTSLYNFSNNTWTRDATVNIPRGYNSTVTLSNGSAFTLGGSWSGGQGGKHGEVWTSGSGWRRPANTLVDPIIGYEDIYRSDNHSWLFSSDNGRVFYAGPGNRMQWYDTNGNGSVTFAGNRGDDTYSQNGNAVMFAPGKILKAGGAAAYERQPANPRSYVIDINGGVTTKAVGSLSYARAFANAVVLADGGVMIVGGMPNPVVFSDTNAVLTPELWSPRTEQWTQLANHQIARTYHSVALLLPDGRVLAGGGGLCGGCGVNHPDAEIFSPPYLFTSSGGLASRPVISTAPTSVGYGQTFNVTLASGRWASGFHLVRLSSLTHSVNNDQRFISLDYGGGAGNYTLTAPANSGIAPGGYYMLFALDSQGVPSVAKIIRLG